MGIAVQAERLIALARLRTVADREQLLLAIIDLCDSAANIGALDLAAVDALLTDIFMCLVVEAEHDIRRRRAGFRIGVVHTVAGQGEGHGA